MMSVRALGRILAALLLLAVAPRGGAQIQVHNGGRMRANRTSGSRVFTYTGGPQTFTVPAGVTQVLLECWGAQGGTSPSGSSGPGGLGGYARGTLAVTPGQTLTICVGEQQCSDGPGLKPDSYNGGGGAYANAQTGGGGSDVRAGGTDLASRVIVAGGGGGGFVLDTDLAGGAGGGSTGGDGQSSTADPTNSTPGFGGTQTAGGLANPGPLPGVFNNGSLGQGGKNDLEGAGGGGGYFGGAAGWNAGGGGGSGYIGGVTGGSMGSGVRSGHGQVTVTY